MEEAVSHWCQVLSGVLSIFFNFEIIMVFHLLEIVQTNLDLRKILVAPKIFQRKFLHFDLWHDLRIIISKEVKIFFIFVAFLENVNFTCNFFSKLIAN